MLGRTLRSETVGTDTSFVFGAGFGLIPGIALAQTTLAEIILRLNTGLVTIITSFLNSDKKGADLDYRSLTDLSERSRIDTCRTLRQLFQRVTQVRRPLQITDANRGPGIREGSPRQTAPQRKRSPKGKSAKVRGPMVAQVIIADSSKPGQLAIVRPAERRKKSTSSSSGSSSLSKAPSASSSALSSPLATPPPEYTQFEPQRPPVNRTQTAPAAHKPHRKQSTPQLPPKETSKYRATQSTSRLETTLPAPVKPPPPLPPMAAMSTTNLQPLPRRRKPTPTYYSIASGHTQIGEIPLHEWAQPFDFDQASILNREAYKNGWPANQFNGEDQRKKRFGIGRLFGRK